MKQRFGKFALVGCLGAVWQLSMLALLTNYASLRPVEATLLSVELAVLHNFFWHERYTWRERRRTAPRLISRLGRFHFANGLVSLMGNGLISYLLVSGLHLPAIPCAFVAIGLCSLANFALAEHWVYPLRNRGVPQRGQAESPAGEK